MSQEEQPRKPSAVKYGDVFSVSGELASEAVAPVDAAMMQSAEAAVLGRTHRGGPAAAMQAAATQNERAGLVGHADVSPAAAGLGVTVSETDVPGYRIVTESVAGQVVKHYVEPMPSPTDQGFTTGSITIGDALETAAKTAGDKVVEPSDAAAIQAAEVRATGSSVVVPGGLAAEAQSAASFNATVDQDRDKVKLRDVLQRATTKLPADKAATRQDAEGVVGAELRNNPNPNLSTHPGGVASSVTAAANLNEALNI